jgi:glycosyltransferase involved in cell wall biosynthesis
MKAINPKLSVIIPTYNRAEMLKRVIEGILNQTFQDFETIVVDDGSTDETEDTIKEVIKKTSQGLLYLKQENKGAGAARNLGIRHAEGELILFIDDDVLPALNLLEEHIRGHQRHPGDNVAILGCVVNSPEIKETLFMRWLITHGPAFMQNREPDGARLDYWSFCTANVSVKRQFLLGKGLFDESFRPFYEDIELGYRLEQQGLQIVLNKHAIGFHLRGYTFAGYCCRSENAGESAARFFAKWPAATSSSTPSTPTIRTVIMQIGRRIILPGLAPILKPVICWLDSHDYPVPSFFYREIPYHYSRSAYKKGPKAIGK